MKIGEVIRWRSTPVQNTRKWTLINNICGGEVIVFWVFWSFSGRSWVILQKNISPRLFQVKCWWENYAGMLLKPFWQADALPSVWLLICKLLFCSICWCIRDDSKMLMHHVLLSRRRSPKGGRLRHSCLHRDPLASQDDEPGRERADTTGRAMLLW